MNITIHKNIPLVGKHKKPIVTDFIFSDKKEKKPIVIFCHGYKGFKDWGAWSLMLKKIAEQHFFVVAFNFSHNGGTIQQPIDFPDLESFGADTFTKQQDDLQSVIDEVTSTSFKFSAQVDTSRIKLIGHSRGGGAAILKTASESKITQLITLASIHTYETSFPKGEVLSAWKKTGVWYVENGRTKQKMPHYISFFEDYENHKLALDISLATKKIKVPHLIIHGTEDTSVNIESAFLLKKWNKKGILFTLKTDHVFGTKHPWEKLIMPQPLQEITQQIILFLNSASGI